MRRSEVLYWEFHFLRPEEELPPLIRNSPRIAFSLCQRKSPWINGVVSFCFSQSSVHGGELISPRRHYKRIYLRQQWSSKALHRSALIYFCQTCFRGRSGNISNIFSFDFYTLIDGCCCHLRILSLFKMKLLFHSKLNFVLQVPVLHGGHVCWSTSIMGGVILGTMGIERLNTYSRTFSSSLSCPHARTHTHTVIPRVCQA